MRDTGADRGVLLSEVGFQAGAVRMAYKSNVTLTSRLIFVRKLPRSC